MKKLVKFIIIAAAGIYLAFQIFKYYNSTHILGNQAVFNIYLDTTKNNIDSFFGLKKGTFDKKKDVLICQLPVNVGGFKAKCAIVNFNINGVDCNRTYDNMVDTKYDNSELNGYYFKFLIIKNSGFSATLFDADSPMTWNSIIASKVITTNYRRGKIDNIVISGDSVYDYCAK